MANQQRPLDHVALSRLLRHLDAPARLAENPLVADYFAGPRGERLQGVDIDLIALRVKATIVSAVARLGAAHGNDAHSHGARQRAIISRCDLRREKHATVAADLSISLREFYRERNRAFARLLAHLEADRGATRPPAVALPTAFELELDHAANLKVVGDVPGAFRVVENVARSTSNPRERVRAWCCGIELAADYGDAERGRVFLREAVAAAQAVDTDAEGPVVSAQLEMALAMEAWLAGNLRETSLASERAARVATQLAAGQDRATTAVTVSAFLRAGAVALMIDEKPAVALERLGNARRALDAMRHKPPALLGELLLTLGRTQMYFDGKMERAVEYLIESVLILQNGEVSTLLPHALIHLCDALRMSGDLERARTAATGALQFAERRGSLSGVVHASLRLSEVEAAAGDGARALAFAESAGIADIGGLARLHQLLAMAQARLLLGHFERALSLARAVRDEGGPSFQGRLLGSVLRVECEANEALGRRSTARDCLENAIAILERCGSQAAKAQIYALSARLTGRGEHLALAHDLSTSLRNALRAAEVAR